MSKWMRIGFGLSIFVTCALSAVAQDANTARPKVMQITREYVKPGRSGTMHGKTESAFVSAMRQAKWPTYYLGLGSLSGKSRALFLTNYASFEAWQKDQEAAQKNSVLSAAIDKAYLADGDLLDALDQGVFLWHEEMSLRPMADLSSVRYMEFLMFHVKPGKSHEWEELVKMAKDGYAKGVPDAHWGMFEEVFGTEGTTYLLVIGRKSLAELDKAFADKGFATAMGDEGMKKFSELYASAVEGSSTQLFYVDPKMSYVEDSWIKSDPDFWSPKTSAKMPAAKKPE
jgi:hypothetical protein